MLGNTHGMQEHYSKIHRRIPTGISGALLAVYTNCAAGLRNQIDALAGKTAKFVDDELTWYNSMVVVVFKGALPREVASPPQEYLSELLFIRDSETRVHHVVALGTDGGAVKWRSSAGEQEIDDHPQMATILRATAAELAPAPS